MSYLTLLNGVPDFSKAVISLWFKVPTQSIEAVAQESAAFAGGARPRMLGVLPLIVFGEMFDGYTVENRSVGASSYTRSFYSFDPSSGYHFIKDESHEYSIGPEYYQGATIEQDPSYIGVVCSKDSDTGIITASLQIRLQADNVGTGQWVAAMPRGAINNHSQLLIATSPSLGLPAQDTAYDSSLGCYTSGVVPDGTMVSTRNYVDQTDIWAERNGPDAIIAGGGGDSQIEIVPDTWHHLLLSFDVSNPTIAEGGTLFDAYPCGPDPSRSMNLVRQITNPCKMWIALDDTNYTDKYLSDPSFGGESRTEMGLGMNDVAPYNCIWTTFVTNGGTSSRTWLVSGLVHDVQWPIAGMPTYQYLGERLPTFNHEFSIPCISALVDRNFRVEMAELQMWTGVTLDTSIEINRRTFIDFERDENGNPTTTMKPVDPLKGTADEPDKGPGERLLGKRPEILLHGTNNWKSGKNTGSLGIQILSDGTAIILANGQFVPTAKIEKYLPDPFLQRAVA